MAKKDVLSQEEIDALLETVDESAEDETQKSSAKSKSESASKKTKDSATQIDAQTIPEESFIPVSFTAQEPIIKGQFPVLDKIYDRAMRAFAADIYQLTGKDFEINQESISIVKHREFMDSLTNPSLISIYKFKPLRGKAIILFDKTFVFDLVDYYFGGSTQFFSQKDKLDFTATELKVMDVVMNKLVGRLIVAWSSVMQLDASKFADETNPQLVHITEPDDMLLVRRFNLDFGKETGSFYCILPYAMIEPLRQLLELGTNNSDEDADPNWLQSFKEELMDVEYTLSASMGDSKSTLGKVMSWQVGDLIPLEMSEFVSVDIEGTPGFTATLGSTNDKRALKIIKNLLS